MHTVFNYYCSWIWNSLATSFRSSYLFSSSNTCKQYNAHFKNLYENYTVVNVFKKVHEASERSVKTNWESSHKN